MIKAITRHGNGNALPLDKPLLEQLGLSTGSRVDLVVSGGSLVVTPVGGRIEAGQFARSSKRVLARYGPMLKRLAKR